MRVTSKGQVTIPIGVREKLGIQPNSEVDFVVRGDSVRLVKVQNQKGGRGAGIVAKLRGSGNGRMTTDEILKLMRGDD